MTKAGKKILAGMQEAVAIASGEQPAPRITFMGHAYVPEGRQPFEDAALEVFERQRASGADMSLLDPVCVALRDYLRATGELRGGPDFPFPNRLVAAYLVNQVTEWQRELWGGD